MNNLFISLITILGLSACSTTNTNNVTSEQAVTDSSEQQVCIYTQKVGWHFKQKNCMSLKAYNNLYRVHFLPSPPIKPIQPIYVDRLPNSSK